MSKNVEPEKAPQKLPEKTEKSPQRLAAERKHAEQLEQTEKRHAAALKAAEKRAETAEDVSKLVRSQVADAIALTNLSISDKQQVGSNLVDAFNLKGEEKEKYLELLARHHTQVGMV